VILSGLVTSWQQKQNNSGHKDPKAQSKHKEENLRDSWCLGVLVARKMQNTIGVQYSIIQQETNNIL